VPPPPDAEIVWFGHVPVTVTFVPATRLGVLVPVPPSDTGSVPSIDHVPLVITGTPVLADVSYPVPPWAAGTRVSPLKVVPALA